ncbi:MAG: histidine phosphatase family protein [SAR324 cluster bacterium]|nr:histidine phosphatase family protein [SAR324 cluster bacterium]
MEATTLMLVRHGQTEWNACERLQGQLDSPLTELGVQQAKAAAEQLKTMEIDVFYSSDLGRAVQTAALISEQISMNYLTDVNLRERNFGIMQGLEKTEFSKFAGNGASNHHSGDPDYVVPEGESIRQFYKRSIDGLEMIVRKHAGKTVLAVVHGGILRNCLFRALGLPLGMSYRVVFPNASITVFSVCFESDNTCHWEWENKGTQTYLDGMETASETG